jgi:hypothetical protein
LLHALDQPLRVDRCGISEQQNGGGAQHMAQWSMRALGQIHSGHHRLLTAISRRSKSLVIISNHSGFNTAKSTRHVSANGRPHRAKPVR